MKLTPKTKILIVGLGLLGGSYAMALKRKGFSVEAITKNKEDIEFAMEKGWIDGGSDFPDKERISKADFVIFALYPHVLTKWVEENQAYFKPHAILTDVTGVKECIVYSLQKMLRDDVEYIAAHPMAGREVCGIKNADDSIFKDANYIVVPTEKNTSEGIEICEELGRMLGFAQISRLSPEKHDEMIAFLSQLTHCIAISLMCANETKGLEDYTGNSFRDLTRIARINDEMWSELFLANRPALLREMNRFRTAFDRLYMTVLDGNRDAMREMMKTSTKNRKKFDKLEVEENEHDI